MVTTVFGTVATNFSVNAKRDYIPFQLEGTGASMVISTFWTGWTKTILRA